MTGAREALDGYLEHESMRVAINNDSWYLMTQLPTMGRFDWFACGLVERMLERRGYAITGFVDAKSGLAALAADPGRFDLVVTDYNMPGMSGIDVAREVGALRADLPVALISGLITNEMRERAAAAGLHHLIFKPNAIEELCDAVQRLIGGEAPAA